MAKVDNLNIPQLKDFDYFINLTQSVGRDGVNLWDDVTVVQALLKYALFEKPGFERIKTLRLTGRIDNRTIRFIKKYQRFLRKRRGRFIVDGRIDRPKRISLKWTLIQLNFEATETWLLSRGTNDNYINDLVQRCPQVAGILRDGVPVGTLNIPLEGSSPMPPPRGIGTLNIPLE